MAIDAFMKVVTVVVMEKILCVSHEDRQKKQLLKRVSDKRLAACWACTQQVGKVPIAGPLHHKYTVSVGILWLVGIRMPDVMRANLR